MLRPSASHRHACAFLRETHRGHGPKHLLPTLNLPFVFHYHILVSNILAIPIGLIGMRWSVQLSVFSPCSASSWKWGVRPEQMGWGLGQEQRGVPLQREARGDQRQDRQHHRRHTQQVQEEGAGRLPRQNQVTTGTRHMQILYFQMQILVHTRTHTHTTSQ